MYEVMKKKINNCDERLLKLEKKFEDMFGISCGNCLSGTARLAEGVLMWTMIGLLWAKVFK